VVVKNMGSDSNKRTNIDQTDYGTIYEVPMGIDLSEAF